MNNGKMSCNFISGSWTKQPSVKPAMSLFHNEVDVYAEQSDLDTGTEQSDERPMKSAEDVGRAEGPVNPQECRPRLGPASKSSQNRRHHDSRPFKTRFAMTNLEIDRNEAIK